MENDEWIEIDDFAEKLGIGKEGIRGRIQRGKIKKIKIMRGKKGWDTTFIHASELAAQPARQRRLPLETEKKDEPPNIETENVDIDFNSIASFVPERGKIPYKNLCLAVKMMIERKTWDDIFTETGVSKPVTIRLFDEYRKVDKDQVKKYPTLMSYLNAGRPNNAWNKNMLKKK